jgi:hypothetical protein
MMTNQDKFEIFNDFLTQNNSTFDKPYSVLDNLKKYFFPITQDIIDYVNKYGNSIHDNTMILVKPSSYTTTSELVKNQFLLINYTDDQIIRIQDYFYTTLNNGKFTKYNFDFLMMSL